MKVNNDFKIHISENKLQAILSLPEQKVSKEKWTKKSILQLLHKYRITYGICENVLIAIEQKKDESIFPVVIAEGKHPENGKNASLQFLHTDSEHIVPMDALNLAQILHVPTVKEDKPFAKLVKETTGIDGTDVFGQQIQASHGTPLLVRTGENVVFDETNQTYVALKEGRISVLDNIVSVLKQYELDFSYLKVKKDIHYDGTIVIHGDVPTGYTIKAKGDIIVHGIVEGAVLKAERSVYVYDGLVSLRQGKIEAVENIYTKYMNQANVSAGKDIIVQQSILHTICKAERNIICEHGHIIGGEVFARRKIMAYDIGNRMHTETIVGILGERNSPIQKEDKKDELLATKRKLHILIHNMEQKKQKSSEDRVLLLRLKRSIQLTEEKINFIQQRKRLTNRNRGNVVVKGTIYPNVMLVFGKYKKTMRKEIRHVILRNEKNEIKYELNM